MVVCDEICIPNEGYKLTKNVIRGELEVLETPLKKQDDHGCSSRFRVGVSLVVPSQQSISIPQKNNKYLLMVRPTGIISC